MKQAAEGTVVTAERENHSESVECALCMDNLSSGEVVCHLPCAHCYHEVCIKRWLVEGQKNQKKRCPLCNQDPFAVHATS